MSVEMVEGAPPKATAGQPALPGALADVAMVDAATAGAVGGGGKTMWLEEVRAGNAPKPVIQGHRFTRWLLSDVHEYWLRRIARGRAEAAENAAKLKERATKASKAAQAKRVAKGATLAQGVGQ